MKLIPVGTKVVLSEDVIGTVESITIYGNNYVTYNCSWWNGRSVSEQHFRADSVSPVTEERLSIGFRV